MVVQIYCRLKSETTLAIEKQMSNTATYSHENLILLPSKLI